jgi:hypothetical protein
VMRLIEQDKKEEKPDGLKAVEDQIEIDDGNED